MPFSDENITTNSDSYGRLFGWNSDFKDTYTPVNVPFFNSNGQHDGSLLYSNSSVNNKDSTVSKLESQKDSKFSYHYPEEIENPLAKSNFSDTPPNILRISIKDLEGGLLITELSTLITDFTKTYFSDFDTASQSLTTAYTKTSNIIGNITNNTINAIENNSLTDNLNLISNSTQNFIDSTSDKLAPFAKQFAEKTKYVPVEPNIHYGTIYLYAPNNVETHYGFQYTSTDLTPTYKALDILAGAADGDTKRVVDAAVQAGIGGIAGVISNVLNKFPGSETALGGSIDLKSLIQAKTRLVPLENLEYLFNRTDRRQFVYNFKFYPKTNKEIKTIFKIINALKYYSHPEISAGNNRYLKSPAIFDLQFCTLVKDSGGAYSYKDNLFINKIKPCALTDISINYTDVGRFSTLKPIDVEAFANGVFKSPVGIDLNLTFQELQILTRSDLVHPEDSFKNINEKKYY